ncbi:hypothetical protein [Rufibacter tibetensis]|uniref:Uncharacterized protein n=1 Tax=Rufibacter tibetensis TaxID=512763 RepID=A0A0P0C0J3_9BACT|nr:hypothetical protein [Rufibacter tibetensis]ALI98343.1 hypothetical protein DC20_04280 [Rufibacter tibetensis]
MAKDKTKTKKSKETKDKKNKSLLKNVSTLASNNKKILYSLLGAAGAGIAIAALGKDKRRAITDKVTSTVAGLGSTSGDSTTNTTTDTSSGNKPQGQ